MPGHERARRVPSAIERLAATGPFPPAEPDLMLFGRLVGEWDVTWVALDQSGAVAAQRQGERHFAWVLGRRGIQDVTPERGGEEEQRVPVSGTGALRVLHAVL